MLCPNCKIWELKQGDRFCGFCGISLLQAIRVYLHPKHLSATHSFSFANKSSRRLDYHLECSPWIEPESLSYVMEAGQQAQIKFWIKPDKMERPPFGKGEVALVGQPGDVSETVRIESYPPPQVVIRDVSAILGKDAEISKLEGTVRFSPITVSKLFIDPPYFEPVGPFPIECGVGDDFFSVRSGKINGLNRGRVPVNWTMEAQGLGELKGTFQLSFLQPATLDIKEFEGSSVYKGEAYLPDTEETLRFTVINNGDEALEVSGSEISPLDAYEGVEVKPESRDYPLRVDSGEEKETRFLISIGPNAKHQRYRFRLFFQSNDPRHESDFTIWVNVKDRFQPGFISIDFGTTDSAVAYLDGTAPLNVFLERDLQDKKIFSNIYFKNYDETKIPPYVWCIGQQAKMLGPADRNRFVKGIKTKVGEDEEEEGEEIALGDRVFTLRAEEIVQFILRDLLIRTRRGLQSRPSQAVLSVPTRFSLRQKGILKEALSKAARDAGMELDKIETMDESLAAGLFFLVDRALRDEHLARKNEYTLLVVDCGGGTTDVTLFRVHHQIGAEGLAEYIAKLEIIGAWGDETFGGEDISWKIAKILAERFLKKKVNARDKKDWKMIREMEDEAEAVKLVVSTMLKLPRTAETDQIRAALENQNLDELQNNLKYMKLEGSGIEDIARFFANAFKASPVGFEVSSNNKEFAHQWVFVREEEVKEIYEEKLRALIDELQMMLKRAGISEKVDVALLAGQSSQFPVVAESLKKVANHVEAVQDSSGQLVLKECVSLGAILYSLRFYQPDDFPIRKIEGLNRIWTRLGRPRVGAGDQFEDWIPWGATCDEFEKEIELGRGAIFRDQIVLEIYENHTLGKGLNQKLYRSYLWQNEDKLTEAARFKLRLAADGNVDAKCWIGGKWANPESDTGENQ